MKLYCTYAEWWPLLSAPEEYEEEAGVYTHLLKEHCIVPPKCLLELGSGGGNNAAFMKQSFHITCVDKSPAMLAVGRALNPECEHVEGDMRTIRLDTTYDAVFIHDAIAYMTTLDDLLQAMTTAFVHCRPGGAALFVPDYTKETFRSATYHGGHDHDARSLRYLQWDHNPDAGDSSYRIDFAYLLRRNEQVEIVHDVHHCGLFSLEEWYRTIEAAGFEPDSISLETDELAPGYYRIFIGRKKEK